MSQRPCMDGSDSYSQAGLSFTHHAKKKPQAYKDLGFLN